MIRKLEWEAFIFFYYVVTTCRKYRYLYNIIIPFVYLPMLYLANCVIITIILFTIDQRRVVVHSKKIPNLTGGGGGVSCYIHNHAAHTLQHTYLCRTAVCHPMKLFNNYLLSNNLYEFEVCDVQ